MLNWVAISEDVADAKADKEDTVDTGVGGMLVITAATTVRGSTAVTVVADVEVAIFPKSARNNKKLQVAHSCSLESDLPTQVLP